MSLSPVDCGSSNLYSTFITPWADQSAAHTVEPDYHLPGCYNVQPPPPGPNKAAAFSDETLFFMFYSSPRDALQEVAAQELYVLFSPLLYETPFKLRLVDSIVIGAITKTSDIGSLRRLAHHRRRKYREASRARTLSGTLRTGRRSEKR